MIGYDLDGTICESAPKRNKPYFHQNGAERAAHNQARLEHFRHAEKIRDPDPDQPYVIITARAEKDRAETEEWLANNNLKPIALEMLQTSRTRRNMVEHKIAACRRHKVIRYYEDDLKIAEAIAASGTAVVLVNKK